MDNKLIGVTATFHYQDKDGKQFTVEADFNDNQWNQWGATKGQLSENVSAVESVNQALSEFMRVPDDV